MPTPYPADIPILIGTFAFGPAAGILITVVTALLQGFTVSAASGLYGILMHIIATGTYVLVAGFIYKFHKGKKSAVIALIAGTLAMTAIMVPANLTITPYFMGVPLHEATTVGSLMGTKLVLNEMVAYVYLTNLPQAHSEKSYLITCFALCSFGNFGSIAIQLGGIGELAPNQRKNLARLGVRALIAGTLTCYMSAAIVGVLFN